jgi:uncharacterized protein
MLALLRKLTVEQWRWIDEEYRDRSLPDVRMYWILVTVAICLVLPRYFGTADFITKFPAARALFATLPYPDLWPRLYWAAFKFVNYFAVPALCIRFILRERVRDHGFALRREGRIWLLYVGMFLLVLPMTWGVSFTEAFVRTYPKYRAAGDSLGQFALWGVAYGFQFFMLEFFFRGFGLFAMARHVGSTSIFIMVVPYAMIHLSKPLPETLGSIITGIALGTIALRTRSIYGGVLVHCAVAWSMDTFALMRQGRLPW